MNYIFLDIDGVLNSTSYVLDNYNKNTNCLSLSLDETAVQRLSIICHENNAQVVLSSAWRNSFDHITREPINNKGIFLLDLFKKYNISLVGFTSSRYDTRGAQIKKYIKKHLQVDDHFIIIDDDYLDLMKDFAQRYILGTSYFSGLEDYHIALAREKFSLK